MFLSKSKFPFWSRLALHALWQHGVWEATQCRLFTNMSGVPFASALFLMILRFTKSCFKPRPTLASALFLMIAATGADVVLTLALVAIALRFARGHFSRALLTLAAGGTIAAIVIEVLALALGWWRTSPRCPPSDSPGEASVFGLSCK